MIAPSRRRFLALSAAGAALAIPRDLLASVPALPWVPPAKAAFGADDFAVLDAIKEAIYGPGAEALDIRTPLAETLGFLDEDKQPQLASLPSTFDLLSRVLVPTFGAFAALPVEERTTALADWIESRLAFRRQVGQALRQLVLAHCYTNEALWPDIGYPGPWVGRLGMPVHPLRFGEPS